MTLTDEELSTLLKDLESVRVEKKSNFNKESSKTVREAVCAFANDLPNSNLPGVLFIGVDDQGNPSNIKITDDLLKNLTDIKTDGKIIPLPVMHVEKRVVENMELAVVIVTPSDMPPVRYDGTIFVRNGPRRGIANSQEERILNERRRSKNLPFDLMPIHGSTILDLSKSTFYDEYLPEIIDADTLEQNGRSYEELLATSRMICSTSDPVPTLVGMLTLGNAPQDFIPCARIDFLRINGIELVDDVVDSLVAYGNFNTILKQIDDKAKSHNFTSYIITKDITHTITYPYPLPSIRQLVYNAVLHRTYENTNAPVRIYWFNDRIEIHSPGGPYGNVTVENFGTPGITDYRNPNIAASLKAFGYVQQFGRGIAIARRELEKNGNPPLEIKPTQSNILFILRSNNER